MMNRPRFASFDLKADFCASAAASISEAGEPDDRSCDRPGSEAGGLVPVEQVRDRQHDHGDGDRLQEPEAREAQRLVPHLVEAVVDLHPQDAAEQVRPPSRAAQTTTSSEATSCTGSRAAREREHDREQREREAVREVGDDVRPARGGDGEEGAVQRERDHEREDDRRHATHSSMRMRVGVSERLPLLRRRLVDRGAGKRGELGHPAAHVVARRGRARAPGGSG